MLDINEINENIERLEQCDTTWSVCKKLAILYTVRDHYKDSVAARNIDTMNRATNNVAGVASNKI